MKKYLLLVVLFIAVAALQSCQTNINGTWRNERIDPNIRAAINQQNQKLFKCLMSNDVAAFKQLLSAKLTQNLGAKADSIVLAAAAIQAKDFAILDEYYTKNAGDGANIVIPTVRGDKYDYVLSYGALNNAMYASVLVSKDLPVNCAILAVYGKIDNAWKLNIIQIGKYSILNKTAPDYYDEAQQQYTKGNLVNAANLITMASELSHPADQFIKYKNEDQMKDLFQKIIGDANNTYHFPVQLQQVKSKPQVFSIVPQFVADATYPGVYSLVRYKSEISIKDTIKLKAENLAVQKNIAAVFKGIEEGQHFIIYQAFNEMPTAQVPAERYGFVQKIK